jgi:hypothetical protein
MDTCPSQSSPALPCLKPSTVRNVADLLALPEWPANRLRLVVKRWQPDVEQDRPDTLTAAAGV